MNIFKIISATLAGVVMLASCASSIDKRAASSAVERQMASYPESRLQDLYKSFFQDRFGPGHIISDRESALKYVLSELELADESSAPYSEPCGWEGRYVRVSLSAVRDSLISPEDLTDAMIRSAGPVTEEALASWKEEWKEILSVIEKRHLDLPGFEEDKQKIDSLLNSGQCAYHHSPAYNKAYHPHYRIVKKEYFPF